MQSYWCICLVMMIFFNVKIGLADSTVSTASVGGDSVDARDLPSVDSAPELESEASRKPASEKSQIGTRCCVKKKDNKICSDRHLSIASAEVEALSRAGNSGKADCDTKSF